MNGKEGAITCCGLEIRQNEGTIDRAIRIILGLILIPAGIFGVEGIWRVVLIIAGSVALVTGILGFCLLYIPLGISTKKNGS
ncbi:MAG: DUF2892 domain-containing protein [Nitrospirota bacterium]